MRLSWEQTYRWNPETLCWDCCWFSLQTLHLSTNTPFIFNCIYFQTCVGSITPPPLLLPISPSLPLTQKQTQIWMLWPRWVFHILPSLSGKCIHLFDQTSCPSPHLHPHHSLSTPWGWPGTIKPSLKLFSASPFCAAILQHLVSLFLLLMDQEMICSLKPASHRFGLYLYRSSPFCWVVRIINCRCEPVIVGEFHTD